MAGPVGGVLHRPHSQGGTTGAVEYPARHNPLHGVLPLGGCLLGGRHPLLGGLGSPMRFGFVLGAQRDQAEIFLELCHLRRWAIRGMNFDYAKCFDLITLVVVLALALELGMDLGTCHALGTIYEQLRWAFKVSGCGGGPPMGCCRGVPF